MCYLFTPSEHGRMKVTHPFFAMHAVLLTQNKVSAQKLRLQYHGTKSYRLIHSFCELRVSVFRSASRVT